MTDICVTVDGDSGTEIAVDGIRNQIMTEATKIAEEEEDQIDEDLIETEVMKIEVMKIEETDGLEEEIVMRTGDGQAEMIETMIDKEGRAIPIEMTLETGIEIENGITIETGTENQREDQRQQEDERFEKQLLNGKEL